MSIFHFFFLIFVANGKEPSIGADPPDALGKSMTFFPNFTTPFFSENILGENQWLFSLFLPLHFFRPKEAVFFPSFCHTPAGLNFPVFSSIFHHFSSFFHQKSIIFHAFLRRKRAAEVTCRRPTTTLPDPVSDPQSWMDVRQDSCRLRLSRLWV